MNFIFKLILKIISVTCEQFCEFSISFWLLLRLVNLQKQNPDLTSKFKCLTMFTFLAWAPPWAPFSSLNSSKSKLGTYLEQYFCLVRL